MKFKAVVLSMGLLVLGVGAAHASSNWIGVNGGFGIPTGDYGDAASTGWNLGVTGTHMVNDQWGVGGDLGYHAWSGSDDINAAAVLLYGPGSEFSWSAFQATAHAVMAFPTKGTVTPYATMGLGLYNVGAKLESPSGDADDSQSKFGFNFGGGMTFAGNGNMRWGMNGAFHFVPAEEDLGSDVNFMTLGVHMTWGVGQ